MSLNSDKSSTPQIQPVYKPQLINQIDWEKKKNYIARCNPCITQLLKKVDNDFAQIILSLGVFQQASLDGQSRQKFYVQNYQKILINFFQFIRDYESQLLLFKQKHQTILSFCDWIQTKIIFCKDKFVLLYQTKDSEPKHVIESNPQSVFKRTQPPYELSQIQNKQLARIQTLKKKKVVCNEQNEIEFSNNGSIYQETADVRQANTKATNSSVKQLGRRKRSKQNMNEAQSNQEFSNNSSASKRMSNRKIVKVNRQQSYSSNSKLKSKQKQKIEDENQYQKVQLQIVKQKLNNINIDESLIILQSQQVDQLLRGRTNQSRQIKSRKNTNYNELQSVFCQKESTQFNFREKQYLQLKSQINFDNDLQRFQYENQQRISIKSRQSLALDGSYQSESFFSSEIEYRSIKDAKRSNSNRQSHKPQIIHSHKKNNESQKSYKTGLLKKNSSPKQEKEKEETRSHKSGQSTNKKILSQQQKKIRQYYSLGFRLRGVFRYPQKRYHIFPQMDPFYQYIESQQQNRSNQSNGQFKIKRSKQSTYVQNRDKVN